jgi:hypothetical protein
MHNVLLNDICGQQTERAETQSHLGHVIKAARRYSTHCNIYDKSSLFCKRLLKLLVLLYHYKCKSSKGFYFQQNLIQQEMGGMKGCRDPLVCLQNHVADS